MGARELDPSQLRRTVEEGGLRFSSTEEVEALDGTVGQARAHEAITFGLEAETAGYNIFATGPVGTGKRTSVEAHLHEQAARRPAPGDWVYLHNFKEPRRPIVVALASGQGQKLQDDMRHFLEDARRDLVAAFESDTYARRRREVTEPIEREQEAALSDLREEGEAGGIALEVTPAGIVTVPVRNGQPLSPADFGKLSEEARAGYQQTLERLAPRMQAFLTRVRALQREARDRLRSLEREVALFAVGHLIDELKERHGQSEKLAEWLGAVADDVTENLPQFQPPGSDGASESSHGLLAAIGGGQEQALARYDVNVFVSQNSDAHAPVILETNPTYPNLFGRIEHQGLLGGAFVTDHRLLRPGAVHRANGGYLMLPAAEVLAQPLVWPKLKEILQTGRIRLENPAEQYALIPTTTLTPEAIELDLKVVLVGSPLLYELAYQYDEDVRKLFRVKAEFDWRVPWDEDSVHGYARFLSSQVRMNSLRHFDAGATARVIEHGARLAEDREWLSTRFVDIAGLAAEASQWAGLDGSDVVRSEHVEKAIERKVRRSDLIEQRILQMVAEGTVMLDFDGARVGQVNGLSVISLGGYSFGRPMRITATAGPGRGALISIERETELSGHIHDKGFLILSGYLRSRYGGERRLAVSAQLVFEQAYESIDGDSAASAEAYALLSELADVPLRQDIAVTGSVNQHGELQAIGGVNEKIEGFYRACCIGGLTGRQGVIVPEANVRNLMLSPDVVDSVAAAQFHVWSATTVDEGIELLTGIPAGSRGEAGRYPDGSVHARVEERLERWAEIGEREAARRVGHDDGSVSSAAE